MPQTRKKIKQIVAGRIDEVLPDATTVGGATAIEDPAAFIDEELDLSAEHVLRSADVSLVGTAAKGDKLHFHGDFSEHPSTRIVIATDLSTKLYLPEDFLRILSVKMTAWKTDANEIVEMTDPEYRLLQSNDYGNRIGNEWKPKVTLLPINEGDYLAAELGKVKMTANASVLYGIAQTLSNMNDTHATLVTGDIIVLYAQADETENGTYYVPATGSPFLITRQHQLGVILTFTAVPAFTVGERVTQGTNIGTVVSVDTANNKAVIRHVGTTSGLKLWTDWDTTAVTGATSTAAGSPSAVDGEYVLADNPKQILELFRAGSNTDTLDRFIYVPKLKAEEIPDQLLEGLYWFTAAKTLEAMRRADLAASMYQKASLALASYKTGIKGQS